jgi:hypothetical protein
MDSLPLTDSHPLRTEVKLIINRKLPLPNLTALNPQRWEPLVD